MLRLYRYCVPRTIEFANVMRCISGFDGNQRSEQKLISQLKRKQVQADIIFEKWVKQGHQPTAHILSLVINNLVKRKRLEQAMEYISRREMYNIQPTAKIHNPILSSLQNPAEIKEHFDYMIQEGSVPDEVSYSILIQKYHALGDNQNAYNTLNELISEGFVPNIFAVFALAKGFAMEENYEKLDEILKIMQKYKITKDGKFLDTLIERIPNPILSWRYYKNILEETGIYSSFLIFNRLLSRLGKYNDAQSRDTIKDVIITLRGFGQRASESVLREIQSDCNDQELKQFLQKEIESPPLFMPKDNNQLRNLVKQRRYKECVARYNEMRQHMIPTRFTFSILMECYTKMRNTKCAVDLLQEMKTFEMQPNSTIVNILLDHLCRYHSFAIVERFIDSIDKYQIKFTSHSINSFVTLWLREKSFWETMKMIELRDDCVPSLVTYSRMIKHVIYSKEDYKERQKQMEYLLKKIMSLPDTWDAILSSDVLQGIEVFKFYHLIDDVRLYFADKDISITPSMSQALCRIYIAKNDPTRALSYMNKVLKHWEQNSLQLIREIIPLLLEHKLNEQIELLFDHMKKVDLSGHYKGIKEIVRELNARKEYELTGVLLCNVGNYIPMHLDALLVPTTVEMIQNKKIVQAITLLTNIVNAGFGSPEVFQMLTHVRNLASEENHKE